MASELDAIAACLEDTGSAEAPDDGTKSDLLPESYVLEEEEAYGAAERRLRDIAEERGILTHLDSIDAERDPEFFQRRWDLAYPKGEPSYFDYKSYNDLKALQPRSLPIPYRPAPPVDPLSRYNLVRGENGELLPLNDRLPTLLPKCLVGTDNSTASCASSSVTLPEFPVDPEVAIREKVRAHRQRLVDDVAYKTRIWPKLKQMAEKITYPSKVSKVDVEENDHFLFPPGPPIKRRRSSDTHLVDVFEGDSEAPRLLRRTRTGEDIA